MCRCHFLHVSKAPGPLIESFPEMFHAAADRLHASVLILPNPKYSSPEHLTKIPRVKVRIKQNTNKPYGCVSFYLSSHRYYKASFADSACSQDNITFAIDISTDILTLYTGSASRGDAISGLLYVPEVEETERCPDLSQIPSNVTHKDDLPNANYALIGFAPWISGGCSQLFLKAVSTDTSIVRAFVFFTPDPDVGIPPRTHSSWAGVSFKNLDFPIYAIQGIKGIQLMGKVAEYSGNMSDAWEARDLTSYYNNMDYARVFLEVDTGNLS